MKLTQFLLKQKDGFIPQHGWNKSRRLGRRMLREEEVILFDKSDLATRPYILRSPKIEEIRCVDEVAALISCLATYEYDSTQCAKEYTRAKTCKDRELAQINGRKKSARSTELPSDSNDLNITQTNLLLRSYKIPIKSNH